MPASNVKASRTSKSGVKSAKPKQKYMWLGYGNYGPHPWPQLGGGFVRAPAMLTKLLELVGFLEKPSDEPGKDESRE